MKISFINHLTPKQISRRIKIPQSFDNLRYLPQDTFQKSKPQSYSKRTGLRSMQHIKGTEREIIEAYKSELPHEIWGNPKKLRQWAEKKITQIIDTDYSSKLLGGYVTLQARTERINEWNFALNRNKYTKNDPFLRLKIMRFVTEKLLPNNKALAPYLEEDILNKALKESTEKGTSFKKNYLRILKEEILDTLKSNTEHVSINGIEGDWISFHIPSYVEMMSDKYPSKHKLIDTQIANLSQDTDWCLRNPYAVNVNYHGSDMHFFVDSEQNTRICIVNYGDTAKIVKGRNQYVKLTPQYKEIVRDFLSRHNLTTFANTTY